MKDTTVDNLISLAEQNMAIFEPAGSLPNANLHAQWATCLAQCFVAKAMQEHQRLEYSGR